MHRPVMLLYSLLCPLIWISVALFVGTVLPGRQLGAAGAALISITAASLISLLFVRRHDRDFSSSEYWQIIGFCVAWALLLDLGAVFLFIAQTGPSADTSAGTLSFVVATTVTLNTLFFWLAFRNFGRRIIRSHLAKRTIRQA